MGGWLGGFVNAGLLAGLALASVPLLIHLLNRQRHKPTQWAAMRFILAAYKKTRRRVQFENLILLLLRMAGMALLALAVSRPFTGVASPLAGLTESRRDVVIVLDGSASTGYRENVETVYERALKSAREIVRGLDRGRGDRVRLLLATSYCRLLSWTAPDQALAMLDTLSVPSDEPLDLTEAMGEVLKFAQADAQGAGQSTLELYLLTDMQRRAFASDGTMATAPGMTHRAADAQSAVDRARDAAQDPAQDGVRDPADRASLALFEVLDKLRDMGLRVLVQDLGASQTTPPNLGIASIKPLGQLLGAGLPAEISVDILNHGPSAKAGVRVVLEVDGERRPHQMLDVPARSHAEAVFSVVFDTPGEHVLVARLEGDRLSVDDARVEALRVPPPVRVLLVNGAPARAIDEDEVGYLRTVLEPVRDDGPGAPLAPFEPREVEPEALSSAELDLSDFDVIWLANVESLSSATVDRLERHAALGGGLIFSMGDRVVPENYNSRLFRADKSGLLPAELKRRTAVSSRRESYYRVKTFDEQNPALAFFADDRWRPLLAEVPIYEFMAARPADNARVLATLDDEGAHPLLVERDYDRGRVFLWTTSIDPSWTRISESPRTMVPLIHELLRYATSKSEPPRNVRPGEPLLAEVSTFPRNLHLVRPDGTREPLDGEVETSGGGRWKLPTVPGKDTERAGWYKIEMDGAAPLCFAVQLDATEGDLERISPAELDRLHPIFTTIQSGAGGREDGATPAPVRGELWRWCALACLAALVLESLWAAWLGAKRSPRH